MPQPKTISFYAFHARSDGKLQQVHITMEPGKFGSRREVQTDVTYKTMKAANADMERLNCRATA